MNEPLVPIRAFTNPVEAEIAQQALEQAGIHAFVQGAETANLWQVGGLGEIQIEVVEGDVARAEEILDELCTAKGRRRQRRRFASQASIPRKGARRRLAEKGSAQSGAAESPRGRLARANLDRKDAK